MNINFFSDLSDELQAALKECGLNVPSPEQLRQQDKRSDELKDKIENYDLHNLLHHFFTVYTRRISVRKWNVHVSDKLSESSEIIEIVNKLSHGNDINILSSNRIRKLNQSKFADLLLSEWGIHHLHFDESRSNELLFIYFSESDAYLIDILQHEKADGSVVTWTNTDLIQVMHDNWPSVLKPYVLKTNSQSPVLTTKERRALRNKAANTTIVVNDGTEYMPMGGGYSASNHPTSAIVQSDSLYLTVKQLQKTVEENYPAIQQALSPYTSSPNLELKLGTNLEAIVVEVVHKVQLNLQ
ncbi:hypothetical protein H5187_10975 [Pseudoalteromonas sp. SG44-1]|uniref:hypothetical protein n=1 Tax=unclassified Pseudoalteromonas TaxID=194690 RepID=UPI00160370A5|nr:MULTISPECIES: hypothetical protein [unclassified Pseudoalteromonas]MBB1417804.1 hypothetical protein [Pseudoalteromonas sp. SG44-1]MBB1478467.1 hypothetical protein [Pseudoalteromonas sp. SG41-2]